ncbi:MAG: WG repeat-containing protein [Clostridia bacterium]|nr:WG repeat-containing protein [Clostridia bacterium]
MGSTSAKRRRLTQFGAWGILCLCALLLVGLCTNTLVLPFVNLSAAVADKEENLVEPLKKPEDGEATPVLSFLDMLYHFSEATDEKAKITPEFYTSKMGLRLIELEQAALPTVGEVDGVPALQARMGFLVRTAPDGTRTLMDADGTVLVEVLDEGTDLIGHWDENGNAVFKTKKGYRVYSRKKGEFVKTNYDPHLSAIRGVDLPIYYERPDSRIALSYKDGYYGYFYTDTGDANYQYTHKGQSYQFREGCGALGTADGIIVVDYVARRLFVSWGTLLQPEGEGIERLGYYRMDHGLMLVSRENDAGKRETLILTEDESLVYLPRDFNLVCYSDGVFLLEKDGRYGYLDYTGRWITDPVYTAATPFSEGLAVVTRADGKVGMIDTAGGFVIPCEFEKITSSGGAITLYGDGRWVVLNKVK